MYVTVHKVTWTDDRGRLQTDYRGHAVPGFLDRVSTVFVASTVANDEVRQHVKWAHGHEIDHSKDGGVYRSPVGQRVRYVFMRARRDGSDAVPETEAWNAWTWTRQGDPAWKW